MLLYLFLKYFLHFDNKYNLYLYLIFTKPSPSSVSDFLVDDSSLELTVFDDLSEVELSI